MPRKKSGRGKRYTAAEKGEILETARAERLTAKQVQKRFGVSPITFYRWRGPVRKGARGRGTAAGSMGEGLSDLREQVRSVVRRSLPAVIREEVGIYLDRALGVGDGRRKRGRRGRRRGAARVVGAAPKNGRRRRRRRARAKRAAKS